MTISLTSHAQGVLLPVQARAGARKNGIAGVHDGRLKVAVTQVAEKGKANEEIVRVVAEAFGLGKSRVSLISGETNPRKVFLLSGMTINAVEQRIAELLGE